MRHESIFVSRAGPSVHRGESENTRAKVSLGGVVFDVAFTDQFRPLKRRVVSIGGFASLRYGSWISIGMFTVDVFGGSIDEYAVRPYMLQKVSCALSIGSKRRIGAGARLIHIRSEVNYCVVVLGQFRVSGVENV